MEETVCSEEFVDTVDAGSSCIGRRCADGVGNACADGNHIVAVNGRTSRHADTVYFGGSAVGGCEKPVNEIPFDHIRCTSGELNTGNNGCSSGVGVAQIKNGVLGNCMVWR